MSQGSYLSASGAPARSVPTARVPAVQTAANAAPQEVDIRFDGIDYIKQKDGFFKLTYALNLPRWALASTVKLALDPSNLDYNDNQTRLKISMQYRIPSILIQPRLGPRGSQCMTGGNLMEFEAKELLWLMSIGGMWAKRVTAYIVVYAVSAGGLIVKVSWRHRPTRKGPGDVLQEPHPFRLAVNHLAVHAADHGVVVEDGVVRAWPIATHPALDLRLGARLAEEEGICGLRAACWPGP